MMQIRELCHQEIDTFIEFLQAMLREMESFGSSPLQDYDSVSNLLREPIQVNAESPDYLLLVAELGASPTQLIGMLEAKITKPHQIFLPQLSLHISAVYVVPEYRRSRVGRSLIEAAFQWGREKGCIEAELNVLQHNSRAKSLYEGLGFEMIQIEMRRKL